MSANAAKIIKPTELVKQSPSRPILIKSISTKPTPIKKASTKAVGLSSKASSKSITSDAVAEATSQSIEATHDIAQTIGELKQLDDLKKVLLAKEDTLRAKVMNYMQMHIELKLGAITIATWKSFIRNNFDLQTFKKEFPDLYDSYTREINVRTFRIL